jgi:nicotinamidase-related amidase
MHPVPDTNTWDRDLEGLPRLLPRFTLEPTRTALVVVDLQRSMASRTGGIGRYLTEKFPAVADYYFGRVERVVVPTVQKLLEFFRSHQLRIVYITGGPELPDGADYLPLRRLTDERIKTETGDYTMIVVRGHPEHATLAEVAPRPEEPVLNKITRSPFASTGLDQLLRNIGVTGIVLAGVNTNVCVETTARDACDRGYRCVMVADGCATFDAASHEATLKACAGIFGRVALCDDLLAELEEALKRPAPSPPAP